MEKEIAPIMTEVRFRFLVKHVLCAESCSSLVDTILLLYHDILISLGLTCWCIVSLRYCLSSWAIKLTWCHFPLQYWEKAEFPFHAIPNLATLGLAGGTTKVQTKQFVLCFRMSGLIHMHILLMFFHSIVQGYGCPGLSLTASAICIAEVARVDASCSTFILVHSSLAMSTIGKSSIRSWLRKQLCTIKLSVTVFFFFFKCSPLWFGGSKAEILAFTCPVQDCWLLGELHCPIYF